MNTTDTNTYVEQVRTQSTNLLTTIHKLRALRQKQDALDLGNTLNQSDIGGANEGILVADVVAVLGVTLEAFEALLTAGHATNLHKVAIV
jgi:hypothetical protein